MDYSAAIRERLPSIWRADGVGELMGKLESYLPESELPGILDAYEAASAAHDGQQRLSGDDYISHPIAVARILADLHLDPGSIKAALLHDVLEDTPCSLDDINGRFGEDVALLVDGVSKLDKLRFDSAVEAQAESFRKMLLAMVQDLRVILVKLADRTHNMRTIEHLPAEKRRRIAKETLEIYAPIANRLGMYSLKVELEDLGFRAFTPFRYRVLDRALRRSRGSQRQFLRRIVSKLKKRIAEREIKARLVAREKRLYSIYSKMRRKHIPLSEIVDVFGVRIVVADIDTCYRMLGLVHELYKPMPGRFKDYISIPRVNGYQSLHTTLFGPKSMPLEVQIRTEEMDQVAERGIAAHWQYKAVDKLTHGAEARAREWLQNLMEMQQAANSEEFLETVKTDLFPDKVYVFTPKGDIMRLPRGATAVDFAYAVHTDIGNRCTAAKIARREVPLNTTLNNGDTVEIVTARSARPNPNWVNFVTTGKARNAIRAYLKNLKREEARDLGKQLLSQALRPYSLNLRRLRKAQRGSLIEELGISEMDEVYEQIGLGERLAPVVAGMLAQQLGEESGGEVPKKPLEIAGTEGLLVTYAGCCHPIPGDGIVGYMSSGRGVIIHRDKCHNVADYRKQPAKWIPVDWRQGVSGEFQSEIRVRTLNRVGLLADVAGRISATFSNIRHVSVESADDESMLLFRLNVRDRRHLAQVMRSIRTNPEVVRVSRTPA
ncbi:MAG: bifunctional (p)ppGpp synthetase/guanosine-3',5'-bis(diphosphate) 3'-pyrophosphohydrolase [Rhodospirillaceae bacterium]|nr:bifunctional (p)ppGpp synthetase/guanosine-3',5'-bis(diphosphate) 3'-pyrophosphohydrolase [Rhodospirillaceae bacterium]MDE0363828.1 bifunctional (p)ppGpp synthetase/guanosine-3',5'-bis(diphosphate) 3'-pyrophosphohydrolase [Rhodospirillaceae bacterium]